LHELAEIGSDKGRRGDASSCHELQENGRNGEIGGGCRSLPKRDKISDRRVDAVSGHEQAKIGREKGRGGDCIKLPRGAIEWKEWGDWKGAAVTCQKETELARGEGLP